jgi:ABC-2 type transport system ATP-binding protein
LGGDHVIEFALEESADGSSLDPNKLLGLESVLAARVENDGYVLTVAQPHRAIPALLDEVDRLGRPLARLTTRHVSLEDVFVALTGRHLREDNEDAQAAAGPAGRKGHRKRANAR